MRTNIPGGVGGGWDQTGRALGASIQAAGLASKVEYENKGGRLMLGAIAVGKPEVTLATA